MISLSLLYDYSFNQKDIYMELSFQFLRSKCIRKTKQQKEQKTNV